MAGFVLRRRGLVLGTELILLVVSVLITVRYPGIEFDTKRDDLVGAKKKYHQNFLKFKKEFPTQDDLVVVVESEDPEKNRQFVERLGAKLEAETNLFRDVFYKGDMQMLGSKALLFAQQSDLTELKQRLKDFRPFIEKFTQATNLDSLFGMVNAQFRSAKQEESDENKSMVNALPALEQIIRQADQSMRRPGIPPSPGVTALFDPDNQAQQDIYVTFANGTIFLVTAQAPTEELNGDSVKRLRELVEQTRAEVPGLNVGLTGEPVLETDEMEQSQRDATLATIVSLILCALIFIYGYQETGRPIKATICLVVGLGYTLAFSTLVVHHLNILTITFMPILIGLAIDYGVHLISRYEEELRYGRSEQAALTKAMIYTGQGIFSGALTTAGAFLAMGLTDFKGIQEMGIICGGGLLICLVPMMTMLPALLLRGRQNTMDHEHVVDSDSATRRARIEKLWLGRPVTVTCLTLALCVVAATQLHKVYFDYNLLNMQSAGLPAVEFEKKLIYATNSTPKSVLYAAVIATNLPQAVQWERELTNLPAVAGVESITKYLAEDPACKLQLIGDIKKELASIHFRPTDTNAISLDELSATLYSLYGYLGAAQEFVGNDDPALTKSLRSLFLAIEKFRRDMLAGSDEKVRQHAIKLEEFQAALFRDIHDTFTALKNQDDTSGLRVKDLPQALRDRFVGVNGSFLLMVNPKKDVWSRQNQQEFISQIRTIDPNVTGTPVQLYEYTGLLVHSYVQAALYALGAIILLVFFHFRNVLSVVLALVPVAIGCLWLGGIMGLLHIPLNPANIMTLPLVIGIGVTNGIHILNRYAEEQTPSILARSTGKAVLVSGLTTIAGFGSLMLGKHRGIESLGYVMSTGLASCMIAALMILPALLTLYKNRPSADNARSTLGREEPRF